MKNFIVENWQILLYTAAIILSLIGVILENCIRKRLKKSVKTPKELQAKVSAEEVKSKKAISIGAVLLSIPQFIREAEEVFKSPKSGSIKFGYVIQQCQKMLDESGIQLKASDEFADYIESILSTPEKKGE